MKNQATPPYHNLIVGILAGRNFNPRHIEAYMRQELGVLSEISPAQFVQEVELAVQAIEEDGEEQSERFACSMGL